MLFSPLLGSPTLKPKATSAAPVPQPGSIYTDPAYLAYLRSVQGAGDAATATATLKMSEASRALANSRLNIEDQGQKAIKGIGGSFHSRGLYKSGQRLQKQSDAQVDTNKAIAASEAGNYSQQQAIQNDLLNRVTDLRQRAAEQALLSAQRQYGVG